MTGRRNNADQRTSGIPGIGKLSLGTHLCQFYSEQKDLLEILIPYFKSGLAGNECCVWIADDPLCVEEAKKAFKESFRRYGTVTENGQLKIIPSRQWIAMGAKSGQAIVKLLDETIRDGFDSLRLASPAIQSKKESKEFICYGADAIGNYNAIGLFLYPRDRIDAKQLMEVVNRHRYSLIRNDGKWEVIEGTGARIVKDALKRSEKKL